MRRRKTITTVIFGIALIPNMSFAQTVEELQAQTALDTAQAERINAQAAILDAENTLRTSQLTRAFGSEVLEGNEGTIELSDGSLNHVAYDLVYKSLDDAAAEIVKKVCVSTEKGKKIIFADPAPYLRVKRQYDRVKSEVTLLTTRIENLQKYIDDLDEGTLVSSYTVRNGGGRTPSVLSIVTVITALPLIAGQFDNIASLFRTNTELSAVDVTVSDDLFIRTIKSKIIGKELTTCPKLTDPELSNQQPDIVTNFENVATARDQLVESWFRKSVALSLRRPPAMPIVSPSRADYDGTILAVTERVNAINTSLDMLSSGLYTVNPLGVAPIDTFYAVGQIADEDLFLEVAANQASAIALETNKPLKSARLQYAGLVNVSYELKTFGGNYKAVGVISKRTCSKVKKASDNFVPSDSDIKTCEVD